MKKNLTHEESLTIIQEMIGTARGNLYLGGGKFFLLWGYLITLASLFHFCILMFTPDKTSFIGYFWIATTIIGFIISFYMGYKDRKKALVKTIASTLNTKIWMGFGVCVVLILFSPIIQNNWLVYPAISTVYIYALYLSVAIYRFKEMRSLVLICLICLLLYSYLPFLYYPLVMAAIMFFGNIMPGHIIRSKTKKNKYV